MTNSRISQFLPMTDKGLFPSEFEILRLRPNACRGPNDRAFANCRIPIDIGMGFNDHIIFKSDCSF